MLTGLHRGGKLVKQSQVVGGSWGGRCDELPTSYLHSESGDLPTRSLSQGTVCIWGEQRQVLPLYFLLSGIPKPPVRHPPPYPETSPGGISVLTWGYEFFYLGVFALEDDMRARKASCPAARQLPVQPQGRG